ncbi:hypothetical protein [Kocuria sp. KH4]
MAKIKASTLLRNPTTGAVEFLKEGSTAPAWAVKAITNPDVLDQPKRTAAKTEETGADGEDKASETKT